MPARNARSAVTHCRVLDWLSFSQMAAMRSSLSRTSMPTAPCPTQGNIISVSRIVASNPSGTPSPSSRPSGVTRKLRRCNPASASTVASNSARSASFCIRVTTLPRMSGTLRPGFSVSNWAFRRLLLGATTAPAAILSNMNGLPVEQGLYDPRNEHDACGLGFVVNIKGEQSHEIILKGIEILINLAHRGACGCDPETGDGAGILIQIPHKFFARECATLGFTLPPAGGYGVGMVFLDRKSTRLNSSHLGISYAVFC